MVFGRENLSPETRDMLLYGQLQEGLSYSLVESPSVSGAQIYRELCVAAKKEEQRLAELMKKQQYLKPMFETTNRRSNQINSSGSQKSLGSNWSKFKSFGKQRSLQCYVCYNLYHLARDCHKNITESQRKSSLQKTTQEPKGNKMILSGTTHLNRHSQDAYK